MTDERISGEWRSRLEDALGGREFEAAWWLKNPHAQTLWSPLVRRRSKLAFEREWLETPDGDRVSLNHVARRSDAPGAPPHLSVPRALLLHGLEGSRDSNYVGGTARRLRERGFDVTVLEFRSCSGELNRAPRLYHSGETTDLAHVVERLTARRPGQKLYIAGVSLGANVLLKWLAEGEAEIPREVHGAAAVCTPFDLTQSGPTIDRALGGFYRWWFLRSLRQKAMAKAEQFPDRLDREKVSASRTFEEYDTWATAALHGYEDAWDYWRRASSGSHLAKIQRPTLLISAEDDPFNPKSSLPHDAVTASPWLFARFPAHGGHVGFVEGRWPWRANWWAEEMVERFFVALADSTGREHSSATAPPRPAV